MDEQIRNLQVEALWVQGVIAGLTALGMVAYFLAEVVKLGSDVYKKVFEGE